MTHPFAGAEDLPSWRIRLLERIQDLAYTHYRTTLYGYPTFTGGDNGLGDGRWIQLERWQSNLRALKAERDELAVQAYAAEIPERMIDHVIDSGGRGIRWGDDPVAAQLTTASTQNDLTRSTLLEMTAGDVWALEHTALVRAEHLHRVRTGALPDNEPGERQLHNNMAALWRRITATATTIDIAPQEAEQLWGRSEQSWQRLAEMTVASYTDLELQQRFGVLAWKGIETEVTATAEDLATTRSARVSPPTPMQVAERAEKALAAVAFDDGAPPRFGHGIGSAIEATAASADTAWTPDPVPEPHPPDRGTDLGQGVW